MQQHRLVDQQFGQVAQAYLTSAVHAQGADLEALATLAQSMPHAKVLDLGSGGGHVSFAMAPHVAALVAVDLSEDMLAVVAAEAARRGLKQLHTQAARAEALPFDDGAFDIVATRFSAHHWYDVRAGLAEARRVLKPGGTLVIVDIVAPEAPLLDTLLQTAEVLRDASHVRDYRVSEWQAMLAEAGFQPGTPHTWKLTMEFDTWIARIRTPQVRADAIRDLFDRAADEARQYFAVAPDHSFAIDAMMIKAV
ncbi:class I SAM-dependent methyltransferase [Ralstonia flaminis]|jgi:ubiquinone/menaquinone biosynthesis C-methylase UbiE|uniref:Methyltransferase YcgJ n=1 Tax=Ralstonia flaminis TaxID=3058597 RepID=A0ABM9K7C4_9RALS|nr:methyltransferase domain-containing protein [Ralstonia sp. LMG 18101]CAJ0815205.1 putative methyltransferase YcgJ [Ralstonia sp. LMG 18101]